MPHHYIGSVLVAHTATIVVMRCNLACLVPPNDPKAIPGSDFDPVSHSFW